MSEERTNDPQSGISRRKFIGTMALAMGAVATSCHKVPEMLTEEIGGRPNILIIMADDMGYSDINCYGGEINTPNINSLAEGGVRFTNFYNCARCVATRASILTGLTPSQAGLGLERRGREAAGSHGGLSKNCVTIAEVLKGAGYHTLMSGKWHLAGDEIGLWDDKKATTQDRWPLQRGFDRYYGTIEGSGSYFYPPTLVEGNTPIDSEGSGYYYTDAVTDNMVRFVKEHAESESKKPFFGYLAYTAPHWPLHAPESEIAKYKGKFDKGWDALRQKRYERMIKMGLIDPKWPLSEKDPDIPDWVDEKDKEWWARHMEVYAAQVDVMDQGVGKIMDVLNEKGLTENTLVLFLSDNGGCAEHIGDWVKQFLCWPEGGMTRDGRPIKDRHSRDVLPGPEDTYMSYQARWAHLSNTPYRKYKSFLHEGGISTPLIAYWPSRIKRRGVLEEQVGHVYDLMGTCLDLAGAEYPTERKGESVIPTEGVSIVPALYGSKIKRGTDIFGWEHIGHRAVRKGKWKIVSLRGEKPWELYDIEADRTEMNNLADQYPERVEEMVKIYKDWEQRSRLSE